MPIPDIEQKNRAEFKKLPLPIYSWISSDQVLFIIQELNNKIGAFDIELAVIPRLISRLLLRTTKEESFGSELEHGLSFLNREQTVELLEVICRRILNPIHRELSSFGISVEKIRSSLGQPVARKMTMEKPMAPPPPMHKAQITKMSAPIAHQQIHQTAAQQQPQAQNTPATPRARVMEMQGSFSPAPTKRMIDIESPKSNAAQKPPENIPSATITKMEKAHEVRKESEFTNKDEGDKLASDKETPEVKKPEGEIAEIESTKPIGLVEVVPLPPTPVTPPKVESTNKPDSQHEIERYEDHHPAKE